MKIHEIFKLFLVSIVVILVSIIRVDAQDFFETIEKKFDDYKRTAAKERVLIVTDRDIYAPGDMIWINTAVYDIHSPAKSKLSNELFVKLSYPGATNLISKTFTLQAGNASGFLKIPEIMNDGVYYLKGSTTLSDSSCYALKKIIIQDRILPQFLIKASFPDKEFIPGDQFAMTIEFMDFYNEPERNIAYTIDFYDGNTRIPGTAGKTKKTGLASVNVKIPTKLKSGLFSYKIVAEGKGAQATLKGRIPVLTDQIFIDFFPENGKLISALESKVSYFSYDGTGRPIPIEAELIENGKVIHVLRSEEDGTGSLVLTPGIDHTYKVKVKRPLLLDKNYDFPQIEAKGIGLNEISKNSTNVTYALQNGYQSNRLVYLVGISDGEIFWTSEHEVERTLQVSVDLTKAKGRIAHFVALNAAERIEGEHMVLIPGKDAESFEMKPVETSASIRGKNIYEINLKDTYEGRAVISTVNAAWIDDHLNNNCIENPLPFDIGTQQFFLTGEIAKDGFDDKEMEKYIDYYVPVLFGWDKVLSTKGAFNLSRKNGEVSKNNLSIERLANNYFVQKSDGKIIHINMNSELMFAKANPKYAASLYREKTKRVPSYKRLLADGTPILDVLQTIKPYNLQGSNIVFMGSANSLNFQGGALIAIDGINRGTDANILKSISPYDVETMTASTDPNDIQRYTGLNSVGVIEITLKKGEVAENEEPELMEDAQFSAPEYVDGQDISGDDYRSTLLWKYIDLNADKSNASVTFYNSELISNVKGIVYLFPKTGTPSVATFEYNVK